MVKKSDDQFTDETLFRKEMDGVVPLRVKATTESRTPRRRIPASGGPAAALKAPGEDPLFDRRLPGVSAADGSAHRKEGVTAATLKKLKRGRYPIGDQLDLHGMDVQTARRALLGFIAHAHARSLAGVRVIHGKGLRSDCGPRLRTMAREVFENHPLVLAYVTCKASDGGSGATDVLLKRR